jgi:hypothetical protein
VICQHLCLIALRSTYAVTVHWCYSAFVTSRYALIVYACTVTHTAAAAAAATAGTCHYCAQRHVSALRVLSAQTVTN